MNIKVDITGRLATLQDNPVLVCGNSTDTVTFTFDSEWLGYTGKTARFVYEKNGVISYQDVPFSGDTAKIPAITDIRELRIGVFAEDKVTTTPAVVQYEKSIKCDTGNPEPPSEDVYAEIMRLFNQTYIDPSLTVVDQVFDPTSSNPQSGLAVAEGIESAKKEIMSSIVTDEFNVKDLFDVSPNLYNKDKNIVGLIKNDNTGEIDETQTGYVTTEHIYLKAGTYYVTGFPELADNVPQSFMCLMKYDENKNAIGSRPYFTTGELIIGEDCYIRFSGVPTRVEYLTLTKDDVPTEYIAYYVKLNQNNMYDITNDKIADGTLTKEKTDFFKTSENLINRMTVTKNKSISVQGIVSDNIEYCITDKMLLKPNTTYSHRDCYRLVYFDGNDNRVGSLNLETQTQFTTIKDFAYVIIMMRQDSAVKKYNWQLNEGDTLLEYEPQHLIIDGYRIYDEPDVEVDPIEEFKLKDRIVFDKSPLFTLDAEVEGVNLENDKNATAVYGKYDELMNENPLYITKTEIGKDVDGNSLYRYDFKNPTPYQSTSVIPKVILVSGIHPEFSGIYSLYNTMKQITNSPKLQHIKNEIHFVVVPIVNYYGVNNKSRKNKNGVDLARNFELGWGTYEPDTDPNSETYCGISPLSELETQAIDQLLQTNKDAICFTSCHSFQQLSGANGFIWGSLATKYYTNLCDKLVVKLSQEWKDKYSFIAQSNGYIDNDEKNYIGFAQLNAPDGSEGRQATKYGIQGGTLEVCDYFHYPNYQSHTLDDFVISRGTETYINWILLNVYNYDPNF